jgi:hypothetical protein
LATKPIIDTSAVHKADFNYFLAQCDNNNLWKEGVLKNEFVLGMVELSVRTIGKVGQLDYLEAFLIKFKVCTP